MALARASVGCILAFVCACTYDFDAPFEGNASASGGAGLGSASGGGATGGSGGTPSGTAGGDGGADTTTSISSGPAVELCGNGLDDDSDGLADCADGDCGGTCIEPAPADWTGPVLVYEGPNPAPDCPAGFSTGFDGGGGPVIADPASCSPCACGNPSGLVCGLPITTVYDGTDCSGAIEEVLTPAQPNACAQFSVGDASSGRLGGAIPIDQAGSCNASGGDATVGPAAFSTTVRTCLGDSRSLGCSNGQVCAPSASAPFEATPCIQHDGDVDCPNGAYGVKRVVFASLVDTRGCSACTCSAPTNVVCTGTTTLYGNSSCSGAGTSVNHVAPVCGAFVTPTPSVSFKYAPGMQSAGPCDAQGAQPTGNVGGGDALTLCCL